MNSLHKYKLYLEETGSDDFYTRLKAYRIKKTREKRKREGK